MRWQRAFIVKAPERGTRAGTGCLSTRCSMIRATRLQSSMFARRVLIFIRIARVSRGIFRVSVASPRKPYSVGQILFKDAGRNPVTTQGGTRN